MKGWLVPRIVESVLVIMKGELVTGDSVEVMNGWLLCTIGESLPPNKIWSLLGTDDSVLVIMKGCLGFVTDDPTLDIMDGFLLPVTGVSVVVKMKDCLF